MKWIDEQRKKDPLVAEMFRFRAVRWTIFVCLGGVFWATDGFSTYKGWLAMAVVGALTLYGEIASMQNNGEDRRSPPSDH